MNRAVETYLFELEDRLEAPYRARYIIRDFFLSLALVFAIGFVVLL